MVSTAAVSSASIVAAVVAVVARMFERTLQDLIRGLRALKGQSKAAEDAFLASALDEIREELRGSEMGLKADAVLKMCYVSTSSAHRSELIDLAAHDAVSYPAAAVVRVPCGRGHELSEVSYQACVCGRLGLCVYLERIR